MTSSFWNEAAETMHPEQARQLQFSSLRRQVERVYRDSAYYREKFDRAGVHPDRLRSLADYAAFPFFDKDEERLSQAASRDQQGHCLGLHVTCDPKSVVRISSTSGTTGAPTFTGFTQKDRDHQAENSARAYFRAGIRPGDVVLHASVLSMWIAGLPFCDSLMSYGACVIPLGALSGVERFAQVVREVLPKVIMCTPSYADHLIDTLPVRAGIDAAALGVRTLIVYGEPGGSIAEVRQRLSAGFGGAEIFDLMGATGCHSPTAISCEMNSGLHFFAPDNCLFEVVDPDSLETLPLEHGVEGEVVFTGLLKECAPLIRWRDKDMVRIMTDPCGCGRPGFRYEIKGRSDDMLLVKGVNVYPHAIKEVVLGFVPRVSGQLRVVKPGPSPVVPSPLWVRIERSAEVADGDAAALAREIEDRIHHLLRFRAKVELVAPGSLGESLGGTHKSQLVEKLY